MNINKLISPILQTNCYIITFDSKVIIIDPAICYEDISKYLQNYELAGIFLTHGHADHFSYLNEIYQNQKCKIYLHTDAIEKLTDSYKNCSELFNYPITFNQLENVVALNDNDIINIDGVDIKVLYTPGHTNCSVCYLIQDHIFSGDTLFHLTAGRTDLYSSSYSDLKASFRKLKQLDRDYFVHPGHGKESNLFFEFLNNKYFSEHK